MTCTECREQLELSFGQTVPDAGTIQHLNSCAGCSMYWEQLVALAQDLSGDAQFSVDNTAIDKLVQEVEDAIQPPMDMASITQQKSDKVSTWNLMRLLPAAAAVLLVVGVGVGGYLVGRTDRDINTTSSYSTTLLPSTDDETAYDEPDDPTFAVLLSDFAADRPYDASEKLLDDITDEEMEYLAQNFDVGDLL